MKPIAAWLALVAFALPLAAHNSFAAEYDGTKPVYVTGMLTKVEWTNSHKAATSQTGVSQPPHRAC